MDWTQAERDDLATTTASGIRRMREGDRDVEFEPLEERLKLLSEMERRLNSTPTHRFAAYRKGT